MANPWLTHLKAFYAKNKSKMSYSQAMKAAKATYKRGGGKAAADGEKKKPRRRRKRRVKKV